MILGIDAGLTGAIGVLDDEGRFVETYDLPVMASGTTAFVKQQLNAVGLLAWLRARGFDSALETFGVSTIAVMEQVSSRPAQGVASVFSFGDTIGALRTACAALNIPLHRVEPRRWKKGVGLPVGADKEQSRRKAIEWYPTAELHLKKHQHRAEALLIARWAVQQMTKAPA